MVPNGNARARVVPEVVAAMTELFYKMPRWLAHDARAATLPAEAQVALWRLATVHEGQTPLGDLTPAEAFDALMPGAGESIERALGLLLVSVQRGSLVLLLPSRVRVEQPPAATPPTVPSETEPAADVEERVNAGRERRLRYDFKHRVGPCAKVDPALSWEAWCATAEGEAVYRRRVLCVADAPQPRNVRGTFGKRSERTAERDRGTFHGDRGTPPRNAAERSPLTSSETSWIEEKEEREKETEEPRNAPAERQPQNASERTAERSAVERNADERSAVQSVPRCPTRETARLSSEERTTPRVTAGEVFFHLRGDGGLRLSAGVTHEKELDGVLEGVTPAWTLDGVKRLAVHIKAGHLRDGWKPKLDDLRGKDGSFSRLLTLHDEAQDCPRCNAGTSHETPTGRRMFVPTTRPLVVATPTKRELEEVVRGSNG